MSFKEGYLEYPDGLKVRFRINEHNKGTLAVFLHGAGERLEMYDYLFPYFETAGIALNALELRGHGLSGGGNSIRDFSVFVTDLRRFLYGYLQNRPVYLVASGAGVLCAVRIASDPRFSVKGLVFVSPCIFPRVELGRMLMIRILSRIMPHLHIPNPAQGDFLRCMECSEAAADSAAADGFSAGFAGALFSEMKRAQKDIPLLKNFPALLLLGENDPVMDAQRTEELFKTAWRSTQNLTVASCRRCGHHILLEKEKIDFVDRITRWIHKLETGIEK